MSVTAQNILDDARAHLADVESLVFDNTKLLPFLGMAHREAFRAMERVQRPSIIKEAFHNLPAHTSVLSPSSLVVTDFDSPVIVEERGSVTITNVTGCTVTSGVASVSTAPTLHGLASGNQVVILSVGGISGINGLSAITVTSTTAFTVNGRIASGTYSSGGTVSTSTESFQSMDNVQRVEKVLATEQSALLQWAWKDDYFNFPPCNEIRQIRIQYVSSGNAVTGATDIIIPDIIRDFLALRTAGLAALAHGAEARGNILNAEALGPTMQADASGGALLAALQAGVRAMQAGTYRRLPYRSPRANLLQLY